jgi:membrane peptidoglycan carboxypeptidase
VVGRPYTLEILSEVRDFRIMVGLQYLVRLARACGIDSPFEPVPSLPLGSNVVTLAEITRMYETLVTGSRHDLADVRALAGGEGDTGTDPDSAAIIERIETPEGRVVYTRSVHRVEVIHPKVAAAVSNILQNVVPHGTGKYAWENVRLRSSDPARDKTLAGMNLHYPLLGKTGTANDYRNAAFVGHVPVLSGDNQSVLSLRGGYTVGVYTAYDTNLAMVDWTNVVGQDDTTHVAIPVLHRGVAVGRLPLVATALQMGVTGFHCSDTVGKSGGMY